jgi:pimeloyl-ACP methyl ester carboxylesterase
MFKRIISALCAVLLFSACSSEENDNAPAETAVPPTIIFVTGWNPLGQSHDSETGQLKEIFPDSKIIVHHWDCQSEFFIDWLNSSDAEAEKLTAQLLGMTEEERNNTILIGHSLGGRVVIKAMADLSGRQMQIRQGIFLGAAIPDNDPDIAAAINASIHPNLNFYNRRDYVLRHAFFVHSVKQKTREFAIGAYGYALPCRKDRLYQIKIVDDSPASNQEGYIGLLKNHYLKNYLDSLKLHLKNIPEISPGEMDYSTADGLPGLPEIQPMPKFVREMIKKAGGEEILEQMNYILLPAEFGTEIDREGNWTLRKIPVRYRQKGIDIYMIFDPRDRMTSWHFFQEDAMNTFSGIRNALKQQ